MTALRRTPLVLALTLAGLTAPLAARAETAPPEFTATSNIALATQYVFRGVSYSQERAAVQGGFDLAHRSGAYLGIWGSSVSSEALNGATAEIDLYGGVVLPVGEATVDVGLLQFHFPRAKLGSESYNTLEAYAAVNWSIVQLKYSHTLGDYFGFNRKSLGSGSDSNGSGYLEANVNWSFLPGWTLNLHAGHQRVAGYGAFSFSDYKVGVTKDFDGGWQLSVAAAGTNADTALYTINGVDTGDHKLIGMLKRSF